MLTILFKLLQTLQGHIEDLRSLLQCGICVRPLYEPYTLACGHTFCYGVSVLIGDSGAGIQLTRLVPDIMVFKWKITQDMSRLPCTGESAASAGIPGMFLWTSLFTNDPSDELTRFEQSFIYLLAAQSSWRRERLQPNIGNISVRKLQR